MTQESRLIIRVDSKMSEQQVKDLDKALMLLERTGLSVTRTVTVTLPAEPFVGATVFLVNYAGTWDINNVTVN